MKPLLIFLFSLTFLVSCDYESDQIITGKFYVDDLPVSGVKVRVASGDFFENCEKANLSAETNSEGKFELQRTILRSRLGPYVQLDSFCVYQWDKWEITWKDIYSPAPENMNFICNRLSHTWHCTMNDYASFDSTK